MEKLYYTKEDLSDIFNDDGKYSNILSITREHGILSKPKELFISHMLECGLTDMDNIFEYNQMYQALGQVLMESSIGLSTLNGTTDMTPEIWEMISIFSQKHNISEEYIRMYSKLIEVVEPISVLLTNDIISRQDEPYKYMDTVRDLYHIYTGKDLPHMDIKAAEKYEHAISTIANFKAEIVYKYHVSLDVLLSMLIRLIRDSEYDINKELSDISKHFEDYHKYIVEYSEAYEFIFDLLLVD